MNILCDLPLLQTLSSKQGWEPALNSGVAAEELQHGDRVAGREGGHCGRQQEELRSSSCSVSFPIFVFMNRIFFTKHIL